MVYTFKKYKKPTILENHLNLGGKAPDGESIGVNSLYFTRDEKPWIGVMGEIHFSRLDRSEWHDRLVKMKAGGITIVSTYVFWIYHEEIEGEVDFTGDNDLRAFIRECQKLDLDVVIRIGPWCHGEVRNGGFPDWLLNKEYTLRDTNPEFMAAVKKWYTDIAEQVNGMFYQDGGNIIAVQIENEFVSNAEYLHALKKLAIQCGILAPLYTVTGWNEANGAKIPVDEVVPVFGGYCDAPWSATIEPLKPSIHYFFNQMRNDTAIGEDLQAATPDKSEWVLPYENYPFATCELGGGIQQAHHRRYIIKGMDIYVPSLMKLGVGNNLIGYYMYAGGTNKIGKQSTLQESVQSGYPNDYPILSYDFQGAVSEFGEIREQYRLLNLLHVFVQDFGEDLAPMTAVDAQEDVARDDTTSLRYAMRTNGDSGFVFINHYQRLSTLEDLHDVVIDTGDVTFPSIDVCGEISFFMPFNMKLKDHIMTYATAQPICQKENTYFFAEIPGIPARYRIGDKDYAGTDKIIHFNDVTIVTLSWEEARFLRKLDGEVYIGDACDLYLSDGEVIADTLNSYRYKKWNNVALNFTSLEVEQKLTEPSVVLEPAKTPAFEKPYLYELNSGGGRKIIWRRLEVDQSEGFVQLELPECDVMQIYADGELVADQYYNGLPWRVPAKLLFDRECYLAYSEKRKDHYKEY